MNRWFWWKPRKYKNWLHADIYYNESTKRHVIYGDPYLKKIITLPKQTDYRNFEITVLDLPWNSNRKKWKKGDIKSIDTVIVHQAGGPGTIEQINRYHITGPNHFGSEGAPHICYDYGIRKNGEICKFNTFEDVLWSNKGANVRGVAILVVGNFSTSVNGKIIHRGVEEPTMKQLVSLKWLITYLCDRSELRGQLSYARVFGHNYFGKPYCPGDTLSNIVMEIRKNGHVN
jgi:hypothetical protein